MIHELSSPYIHEWNSRAKRQVRIIVKCARTMLINSEVDIELSTELLTLSITCWTTSACFWYRCILEHIKIPQKNYSISKYVIFVSYESESNNYNLWEKQKRKIYVSRDVDFNEKTNNIFTVIRSKLLSSYNSFGLDEEHY